MRTIAAMIAAVGLLTKPGLEYLGVVFEDYEHRLDKAYDSPFPNIPVPNKPSASDPAYRNELQAVSCKYSCQRPPIDDVQRGLTRLGIRIKAIGVWDTVGM